METIKEILIRRDGMTGSEADKLIQSARDDMNSRLADGDMPDDICAEYFGLEPDYIFELVG